MFVFLHLTTVPMAFVLPLPKSTPLSLQQPQLSQNPSTKLVNFLQIISNHATASVKIFSHVSCITRLCVSSNDGSLTSSTEAFCRLTVLKMSGASQRYNRAIYFMAASVLFQLLRGLVLMHSFHQLKFLAICFT